MSEHIMVMEKNGSSYKWANDPNLGKDSEHKVPTVNYLREIYLTYAFLAFTFVAWTIVSWQTVGILWGRIQNGTPWLIFEQSVFIFIIQGLVYGNFVYQLTRIGYMRRRIANKVASHEEMEKIYDGDAPPALTILVPSYKEELSVVKRTLITAALQDYPSKRVVLLVDDPPHPNNPWDKSALASVRSLPFELQEIFNAASEPFIRAKNEFLLRVDMEYMSIDVATEAVNLAELYKKAANWVEDFAKTIPMEDSGDSLLLNRVFKRAAHSHFERSRLLLASDNSFSINRIKREYNRLAALFSVDISSFERKLYVNLSHESNKAMNLNSYIRLLGKAWKVVKKKDGDYLEEASPSDADFYVPTSDFLITLDADSLLVPDYAITLVHEMLKKGNERIAVAQTPYNTIPNPQGNLERIAGATTDIQYLIHQGFTYYGATYWVGANALLRVSALPDIATVTSERGFDMPVFIQDRTVIEDTESSVDLVACGWQLYNYPERLAYSATPPDFGSLLIQRRRWANGGLIILPKLIGYLFSKPRNWAKAKEGFFRIHYLASIAMVNTGLLIVFMHSFENCIEGIWLPLTALPYFVLYARDLRYNGYSVKDLVSVYALNLLLIPVNMGGVLKSIHQGIAGHKIPFGRTPKISGRTGIPSLYCAAEIAILALCVFAFALDLWYGRWSHATFTFINGAMFVYGLFYLIGMKEMLHDLFGGKFRSKNLSAVVLTDVAAVDSTRYIDGLAFQENVRKDVRVA